MENLPKPPGPEELHHFHLWLGYCITAWAGVEDRLYELCQQSLNCDHRLAAIVYFRSPGVDTRLSLISELVIAILPERARENGGHDHPSVKDWNVIANEIRALLAVRRRLAHQPVRALHYSYDVPMTCIDPVGTPLSRTENAVAHYTNSSDAESLRNSNAKPLYIGDLVAHYVLVEKVNEQIGRFFLDQFLPRLVELQKKSTEGVN